MKDFATASIAALLIAGFYALGSVSKPHSAVTQQSAIYSSSVLDTVPRRNDTLNKRMPRDTTNRKDTMYRHDSTQRRP